MSRPGWVTTSVIDDAVCPHKIRVGPMQNSSCNAGGGGGKHEPDFRRERISKCSMCPDGWPTKTRLSNRSIWMGRTGLGGGVGDERQVAICRKCKRRIGENEPGEGFTAQRGSVRFWPTNQPRGGFVDRRNCLGLQLLQK